MRFPGSRFKSDHWGWVNAKLGLGVWGFCYLLEPSPLLVREIGGVLNAFIAMFAIFGSAISVYGLWVSTKPSLVKKVQGLTVEGFGLTIAACAPISYAVIRAIHMYRQDNFSTGQISSFAIAYCIAAFLIARTLLIRRFLKELSS